MKTCTLCKDLKNLFCMFNRKPEWYTCVACGGVGCRGEEGAKDLSISERQQRVVAKGVRAAEQRRKENESKI